MAAAFASGTNTYVPDFNAGGKLKVGFSRSPSDFLVNKYSKLTPVSKNRAYYLRITAEEAARVVNDRDFIWPDGQVEPDDNDGQESFEFVQIETKRRRYGFGIGYMAAEQADFNIIAEYARVNAQKAMTNRTIRVLEAGLDTSNYDASHVKTATALGGGFWSAGTATNPIIKKCINAAVETVLTDTLGVVDSDSLMLVIGPELARAISESQEIHEFVKGSPYARDQIAGQIPGKNAKFSLPESLYGVDLLIEKTVKVTSRNSPRTLLPQVVNHAARNG